MSGFTLGQRVRFAEHIKRGGPRYWEPEEPHRRWTGEAYPGARYAGGEGIIIGKRTLSNGNVDYIPDVGTIYFQQESFTAYLVVTSLRSAPVHVLPEHITPLEES